ncbi:MAG: DUF2164 domain-containing protein [Elusimicrobiota bacterium]|jgi:uncharacterized protein (DUF2164 family)
MPIKLEKSTEKHLLTSIQRFFSEELEEKIGDLKAMRVLDFCLKEIAPRVYNQAIQDAQSYIQDKTSELGDARYEPESVYWKTK